MEPTKTNKNKTKIAIIIVIIFILVIGVLALSNSKKINPIKTIGGDISTTNTISSGTDSKQLTDEINNATTFDNEASLSEIDKAF
jgi:cell division protein YceG involved in septum cleavage